MRSQTPLFEVAFRNRRRRIRAAFLVRATTAQRAREIAEQERRDLSGYDYDGTN